jgi:dipeptidyl-peptidase-4
MLRYPDVFHVAVSGSPVTDWRNYDTIYTERYMRLPKENPAGYDRGSCIKLADQLQGKLLLVHGLIDDNVHPSNSWQLIKAFHDSDKRFDLMIYPQFAHGIGSTYDALRWEYFVRYLKSEP